MKRAPNWSKEELEILLKENDLSAEQLSRKLLRRTPGAIGVVRAGIHYFHTTGKTSLLSKMMVKCLDKESPPAVCPVCRERLRQK